MPRGLHVIFILALTFITTAQLRAQAPDSRDRFKTYENAYYIMKTDLPPEAAREASIRMTRMAEEYHRRTKGFSGVITRKFDFVLCSQLRDYTAAGGLPGSAGVYTGNELIALADQNLNTKLWHTVQHEGFHQFADAVIGGDLPIWVDEGLAEYFGEGLFTGDGFVIGVVPGDRLTRLQRAIKGDDYKPISQMMVFTHRAWNGEMSYKNYDQAWAMVHFLVHGDEGKYQAAFVKFMSAVGKGQPWADAWRKYLGPPDAFEKRWRDYWLNLTSDVSADLYTEATIATLTSYMARAAAAGQTFPSSDDFLSAARSQTLKILDDDWLPTSILADALRQFTERKTRIEFLSAGGKNYIVTTLPDDTRLVGSYTLKKRRVETVSVSRDSLPLTIAKAKTLASDGRRPEARALLLDAIRKNRASPYLDEARTLAEEYKDTPRPRPQ